MTTSPSTVLHREVHATEEQFTPQTAIGAVVIGRNEGARLEACLDSLLGRCACVVYVDSGSTDGSPEMARERGAVVVELDMSRPFTAARARNTGVRALYEAAPDLPFVQLLDGDCAIADGWLEKALTRSAGTTPRPSSAAAAANASPRRLPTTCCVTWSGRDLPDRLRPAVAMHSFDSKRFDR